MNRWSIRTRLTVLAAGVTALLCLGMSILLTVVLRGRVADLHNETVMRSAVTVIGLIQDDQVPRVLPSTGRISEVGGIQIVDPVGQVAGGTGELGYAPRVSMLTPAREQPRGYEVRCDLPEFEGCQTVIAVRIYDTQGDWFLYIIDEQVPWYISIAYIVQLGLVSLILVGLTALGTAHTVKGALEPVARIREQALKIGFDIGEGRIKGQRIALPEHDDELRALAKAANLVLARLEATIAREREFTSNASHDLRSPITAMRTELDEAMLYPEEADWPETAEKLTGSLDRLSELVEDLLALSRLDAGASVEREVVDLAALVREEIARRPEDARIKVVVQPTRVLGVRVHLARLFTNLLDNAARHAKDSIIVRVHPDGPMAVLEVVNDGDSIPVEMREAIFDRFTRLDASRSKDTGGSGLGLAICRQIAHAHNGSVAVADSASGARLVVRLPRAPR
ncbi:HAMP domain-containing histidine kinase [Actinocorallia sp. API 0066]|uniref:sensor histidine kinase n=1 Tax=Actinocorallia sp. API 0066 TaxID=2896846 RepID=UPI001E363B27|nr:HAMP domain-containing sensor histidine kinase [Actinocorallia sp. API 0066]MCD0447711.1 HAMP domain-containing histidine kinase [Actinocorallia sp. API 0066]